MRRGSEYNEQMEKYNAVVGNLLEIELLQPLFRSIILSLFFFPFLFSHLIEIQLQN